MSGTLNFTLKVWRQNGPKDNGHFEEYEAKGISEHMSFLEMMDIVNEQSGSGKQRTHRV